MSAFFENMLKEMPPLSFNELVIKPLSAVTDMDVINDLTCFGSVFLSFALSYALIDKFEASVLIAAATAIALPNVYSQKEIYKAHFPEQYVGLLCRQIDSGDISARKELRQFKKDNPEIYKEIMDNLSGKTSEEQAFQESEVAATVFNK